MRRQIPWSWRYLVVLHDEPPMPKRSEIVWGFWSRKLAEFEAYQLHHEFKTSGLKYYCIEVIDTRPRIEEDRVSPLERWCWTLLVAAGLFVGIAYSLLIINLFR